MEWNKIGLNGEKLPPKWTEVLLWYRASNAEGFTKGYFDGHGFAQITKEGNEVDFITHWGIPEKPLD